VTDEKMDPVSASMMALRSWDNCLGALAEVRESLDESMRKVWDQGISRYIRIRWDDAVNAYCDGDASKAARWMDLELENFNTNETVLRASMIDQGPLMMELCAYAMLLATIWPGERPAWRAFKAIVDHLSMQAR
jgi:hypothetical protein